jgi:hypothetical protein
MDNIEKIAERLRFAYLDTQYPTLPIETALPKIDRQAWLAVAREAVECRKEALDRAQPVEQRRACGEPPQTPFILWYDTLHLGLKQGIVNAMEIADQVLAKYVELHRP